ncbi:hypothetical protein BDZ97DRAFT_1923759 [Flammula alnicola]|nr:hypothetical protein BDZ97DRAFT_1923759 [Flammula alnicola]
MPPRCSNRWTQDDENLGSIFHKLVVLPTLAPHLARLEYLDATPGPIILPQLPAVGIDPANTAAQPAATPSAAGSVEAETHSEGSGDADPPRDFFLNVILERTETTYNTHGPGKPKIVTESKPGPKLQVLELSHAAIVQSILEVHGLQERFFPGPISGPPFRVTYKGLIGRARGAPTIRQDDDWSSLKGQLAMTKAAVDSIQVTLSLKDLEPYKNHKRPLSPDPVEETVHGTYVPSVHAYSSTQVNLVPKLPQSRLHGHVSNTVIATLMVMLNGKGLKAPLQPALSKAHGMTSLCSASGPVAGSSNDISDIGALLTACATPFLK